MCAPGSGLREFQPLFWLMEIRVFDLVRKCWVDYFDRVTIIWTRDFDRSFIRSDAYKSAIDAFLYQTDNGNNCYVVGYYSEAVFRYSAMFRCHEQESTEIISPKNWLHGNMVSFIEDHRPLIRNKTMININDK